MYSSNLAIARVRWTANEKVWQYKSDHVCLLVFRVKVPTSMAQFQFTRLHTYAYFSKKR